MDGNERCPGSAVSCCKIVIYRPLFPSLYIIVISSSNHIDYTNRGMNGGTTRVTR